MRAEDIYKVIRGVGFTNCDSAIIPDYRVSTITADYDISIEKNHVINLLTPHSAKV